MKLRLFVLILLLPGFAFAQEDSFFTGIGYLKIYPIFHASMVWEWDDKYLYFDPVGEVKRYADHPAPDLVVITHAHRDHFSPQTLDSLDLSKAELIAPQSVVDKLSAPLKEKFASIRTMANGEIYRWAGASITAVPMYTVIEDEYAPNAHDVRYPRGWGNGYVLTLGLKRFYVVGNSDNTPEMRSLEDIDVVFLSMNQPDIMDEKQAVEAILAFRPKVVYPYQIKKERNVSSLNYLESVIGQSAPEVEIRLREWYD